MQTPVLSSSVRRVAYRVAAGGGNAGDISVAEAAGETRCVVSPASQSPGRIRCRSRSQNRSSSASSSPWPWSGSWRPRPPWASPSPSWTRRSGWPASAGQRAGQPAWPRCEADTDLRPPESLHCRPLSPDWGRASVSACCSVHSKREASWQHVDWLLLIKEKHAQLVSSTHGMTNLTELVGRRRQVLAQPLVLGVWVLWRGGARAARCRGARTRVSLSHLE